VANRGGFWDALDALEQRGTTATVGVFFVDLDEFKDVNDRFGHSVGDMVLVEVARRLEHVVRPGDVVARLGGDEFAVVASSLGGDEDATAIAERIVNAMAEPFVVAGEQLVLGASVGVATVDELGFDSDEFLEQADRALYLAKQAGRGRWARATSEH
jgi:diguanylate cyclase (GGDEF)-like protein